MARRKKVVRNPAASAQRVQDRARSATASDAVTTPAIEEGRVGPDWCLTDLPEELDPRKTPTELERVAHLCVMVRVGEDTFDAEGNQLTGHAIIPRRSKTSEEWEEHANAYTTENIEIQNKVEYARRVTMEHAALHRRIARESKRASILARLKATTAAK